jgi:hypothetical protein
MSEEAMKYIIVGFIALAASSANASVFNYVCKDHGKPYSLKVDDEKNLLTWKGRTYAISVTDCGRAGWHAERDGTSFEFCTATKGYADFEQNGVKIECDLKR